MSILRGFFSFIFIRPHTYRFGTLSLKQKWKTQWKMEDYLPLKTQISVGLIFLTYTNKEHHYAYHDHSAFYVTNQKG